MLRPTAHTLSRILWSERSFFLERQRLPSPQIPDQLASPHLPHCLSVGQKIPPIHTSGSLVPCTPVGLWAQPLHQAQGQLEAWQPEATHLGSSSSHSRPTTLCWATAQAILDGISQGCSGASSPTCHSCDPTFQSQLLLEFPLLQGHRQRPSSRLEMPEHERRQARGTDQSGSAPSRTGAGWDCNAGHRGMGSNRPLPATECLQGFRIKSPGPLMWE